jgi:hypothetical protein
VICTFLDGFDVQLFEISIYQCSNLIHNSSGYHVPQRLTPNSKDYVLVCQCSCSLPGFTSFSLLASLALAAFSCHFFFGARFPFAPRPAGMVLHIISSRRIFQHLRSLWLRALGDCDILIFQRLHHVFYSSEHSFNFL